ncbi:hypothetical protein BB560_006038, partial [Smittium megazygosporum]
MLVNFRPVLVEYLESHPNVWVQFHHGLMIGVMNWCITGFYTCFGPILTNTPAWLEPLLEFIPGYKIEITLGAVAVFVYNIVSFVIDPLVV